MLWWTRDTGNAACSEPFEAVCSSGSHASACLRSDALVRDETARSGALRRILSSELSECFTQEQLVRRVDGVNNTQARAVIAAARPDALLVFGTSIVSAETLALARDQVVNLHTGMSPRYRGTDCTFWPVANREPEWIGATVHECTAAVDGGQIFGVACAGWHPDDRLHELFARAVECGAGLYVDVMRRYLRDGALEGERQNLNEGAEYRGYMRTLGPEPARPCRAAARAPQNDCGADLMARMPADTTRAAADLAVIVVSFNSASWLVPCLSSVYGHAGSAKLEVIIVDNGSTDGSAELVEREFPEALVIRNENRGLCPCEQSRLGSDAGAVCLVPEPGYRDPQRIPGRHARATAIASQRRPCWLSASSA